MQIKQWDIQETVGFVQLLKRQVAKQKTAHEEEGIHARVGI